MNVNKFLPIFLNFNIFQKVNDSSNNSPQIENQSIEKRKILIALAKKKISAFLPAEEVNNNLQLLYLYN